MERVNNHPNILNAIEVNFQGIATLAEEVEEICYVVLDYAEHGPLSNFVRITGGIEEDMSRLLVSQLCNAVHYIHSQGFAHLDLKLENLLLDQYFNLKVADFGSSVYVGNTGGHSDKRRGTPLYMAPEVTNLQSGEIYDAHKADVYSIGV